MGGVCGTSARAERPWHPAPPRSGFTIPAPLSGPCRVRVPSLCDGVRGGCFQAGTAPSDRSLGVWRSALELLLLHSPTGRILSFCVVGARSQKWRTSRRVFVRRCGFIIYVVRPRPTCILILRVAKRNNSSCHYSKPFPESRLRRFSPCQFLHETAYFNPKGGATTSERQAVVSQRVPSFLR